MDFDNINKNIIFKFWETLGRKDITNIPINKFLKKPYLESYIINLSSTLNNNTLISKIIELLDSNKITNEDLFLFINNSIELNNILKKNIELFFLDNNENINNFAVEIIIYEIKYFRFYQLISELLFDSTTDENELYNFILIYIKNNKNDIKNYSKKNIKFNIFNYYLNDLFNYYKAIFICLKKNNLLEKEYINNEILNFFLKNLFTNWYNIYKNDILENTVNEKIKNYIIPKTILSRILCLPNL